MSGDMERMVREFRDQQAQAETERAAEQQAQLLREQEEHAKLLELIRAAIPSWMEAMSSAGNPDMKLISWMEKTGERVVKKSIFGHQRVEPILETVEVVGWEIGWAGEGPLPYDDTHAFISEYIIYLLADGRLWSSFRRPHELGEFTTGIMHNAEKNIPDNLTQIATKNGVDWEFPRE